MDSNVEAAGQRKTKLFPSEPGLEPEHSGGKRRWWLWLIVLIIIGAVAYRLMPHAAVNKTASAPGAAVPHRPPIAVDVSPVQRGDFSRYLTAIGTVTPFKTVTIKSRVDGQLMSVAFKEGQIVKAGQLLAIIDPRPYQAELDQAMGQLTKDRAAASEAQLDLQRDRQLYNQRVIAKQQLDLQVATAEADQGATLADQAAVDNAKLQLVYSRITAPISGRIGLRLVDPGNIVHATDTGGLAVITQLQPIAVLFSIPEDDLPEVMADLKVGQTLPALAYDRDFKTLLATGTLLTLDNEIDQTTGTIRLKAAFPNEDNALFPDQFVNIKLLVAKLQNVLLIPAAAVQRGAVGTYVYGVNPNHTVSVIKVDVIGTQGNTIAAKDGPSVNQLVVVGNLDKLAPGARVSFQSAPAGSSQARLNLPGSQDESAPSSGAPAQRQGQGHHGHRHGQNAAHGPQ